MTMSMEAVPAAPQDRRTLRQNFGMRPMEPVPAPEITPSLPPGEAERRIDHARTWNLAAGIEKGLQQVCILQDIAQGTHEGLRTTQAVNALREVPMDSSGNMVQLTNEITSGTVRLDDGREIAVYAKSENGELAFFIDPQSGAMMRVVRRMENGVQISEIRPHEEENYSGRLLYARQRAKYQEANRRNIARYYGIAPEDVPLSLEKLNLRSMDSGRAFRAEYAASALDRLTGFDIVPPTALRETDGAFSTVQAGAPGEPLDDEETKSLLEKGPAHPGAKSLMRLACFDYLIKSTDRHMNNFFYDPATHRFSGIDNGYSNGYSMAAEFTGTGGDTERHDFTADPYLSYPMEIVEQHEDWLLDDQAVNQLKTLFGEIKNHLLFAEGKMSAEQSAALPEHVKQGAAAKTLSLTFRLLHERVDEQGNVTPASAAIARKEAMEFLRRLNYLIAHRKPPQLPDHLQTRAGLKHVFESQPAQAA